ncbi:MAG: dTMP kinase [Anaerolineae bacterium]|nr:dTMP kinase [Anaerolineae bacterium]
MFITFEGLDGSGKTTQVKTLAAHLKANGKDVLVTREPGGTLIGDQIRSVLQDHTNTEMTPQTELLLFCASRAQIVSEVIRPRLDTGGVVICDRFADSTLAYQGYGRGLDLPFLRQLLKFATGGLQPDLTLYLDLSPEEGLARRRQGSLFGEEFSRIDQLELDFHKRVYEGYQALIEAEPQRWVVIDANQPSEQVQAAILGVIETRAGLVT